MHIEAYQIELLFILLFCTRTAVYLCEWSILIVPVFFFFSSFYGFGSIECVFFCSVIFCFKPFDSQEARKKKTPALAKKNEQDLNDQNGDESIEKIEILFIHHSIGHNRWFIFHGS